MRLEHPTLPDYKTVKPDIFVDYQEQGATFIDEVVANMSSSGFPLFPE
jgi:hypothetical protein